MLTYCFKVCTHPCPRHLPQDIAEPGREEKAQERAGVGVERHGALLSGQEVALLFSGSPRFSFQSHQRSVFSLRAAARQ